MAITYTYKGRRIGETYIKCNPVGIANESDYVLKYIYKPVCGDGEIVIDRTDMLDDNVVPMDHLRLRERIGVLEELKYPVEDICRIVGAPEYLVKQYLPVDYAGLDHDEIHNELHRLYARCTELLKERRKMTDEYRKLEESLKSEEEANDILSKHVKELEEKTDALSGEYICACKAMDEHIKHINALEHKIEDLEHKKQTAEDMYALANKTLCEVRAENAKLQERIDAYAVITRSHIDTSSMKHEAYELGKWICASVTALCQNGKSVDEIAEILDIPKSFVEHVIKDFIARS